MGLGSDGEKEVWDIKKRKNGEKEEEKTKQIQRRVCFA